MGVPIAPAIPMCVPILSQSQTKACISPRFIALFRVLLARAYRSFGTGTHLLAGILYRAHDILVACAAADVASRPLRISASVGLGLFFSSWKEAIIMPGVQKPHC